MADWSDVDDDDDLYAELDVLEASAELSIRELAYAVVEALLFRETINPDAPPPRCSERYEIRGILGEGGYGSVFRAWDTHLGRDVAIKACAVDLPNLPDNVPAHLLAKALALAKAQAFAEAQALAKLSHQANIVTIYDCEQGGDKLFLIMEYVRGGTLLKNGPETLEELLEVFAEVARAMAKAHEEGVIHGDIKPENILLDDDLRPRIADFGLARIIGAPVVMPFTVGTVPYASPKLLVDGVPDQFSDMWAFFVALYECTVGRLPGVDTERRRIPSTADAMLRALEAWTGPKFSADVPPALAEIIRIGLSLDREVREARFPNMSAVVEALENLFVSRLIPGAIVEPAAVVEPAASDELVLEPTTDTDSAGRKGIKGAGIAVLLVVGIGGLLVQLYVVRHGAETEQPNQATRTPTPAEQGEQKIQAAVEIVKTVRDLTDSDLKVVKELWRGGVDLIRLSKKPSDKDLAAKLTLDLATKIQARKKGTNHAAQLATQAAQWREAEGQWKQAAAAQELAVKVYKSAESAEDTPELRSAEGCLASLRAEVGCEKRPPIGD